MLSMYPACFYHEGNSYSVVFPDLNWLSTCGDSFEDAMEMAVDCLAGYLSDIDPVAIAKELDPDGPACDAVVSMVSVDVEEYARKHFEKSVRKTLTIPAWLNTAAIDQGINFSQTLQEALLSKIQAR